MRLYISWCPNLLSISFFTLSTYQVKSIELLYFYPFLIHIHIHSPTLSSVFVTYFSNFIAFIFMCALLHFTMQNCSFSHLCIQIHLSCLWCFFYFSIFRNLPLLHSWNKYVILSSPLPQGVFSFLCLILGPIWNLLKCMVWGMDLKYSLHTDIQMF